MLSEGDVGVCTAGTDGSEVERRGEDPLSVLAGCSGDKNGLEPEGDESRGDGGGEHVKSDMLAVRVALLRRCKYLVGVVDSLGLSPPSDRGESEQVDKSFLGRGVESVDAERSRGVDVGVVSQDLDPNGRYNCWS